MIRGRKRELGLGSVELVSLAEAREEAFANRKLARADGDPLAKKWRFVGVPTFAEAAKSVVEQKRAGRGSAAHARNRFRTPEIHAFPRIGDTPVSEVTSGDVLEILTPIWRTMGPSARLFRIRVRAVPERAIAMEWRTDNPCDRLRHLAGPRHNFVTHHKAVPHSEVAAGSAASCLLGRALTDTAISGRNAHRGEGPADAAPNTTLSSDRWRCLQCASRSN